MKLKAALKTTLSLLLTLALFICFLPVSAKAEDTVYIKTAEDLIQMAKDARLDSFSRGKVYVLSSDVQLEAGSDFQIPVFRGTFEGGNHTISGFVIRESIAPAGLFGIIESDGVVKNLKLSGKVLPSGEGKAVGGIAGINRGLIENIEFDGTVSGKEEVGGIAGVNEISGTIRGCLSSGKISAQKMSGGIAGDNHGMIDACKNRCVINVDSKDPTINIDDIETDIQAAIIDTDRAEKIYSAIEDAGGIAGFSDGIVTNCSNYGDVGYSHIGYNIGGITGRNQGFIYGSSNYGVINGRREVAGIAGQAEPFVAYRPSAESVGNLRNELHNLRDLVDKATRDIDDSSSKASARLSNINNIISNANDNVKELTDALTSSVDENLSEINRGGEIAKSVSDRLDSIAGKLPDINRQLTDALSEVTKGMAEAKKAGSKASSAMGEFSKALDELNRAISLFDDASSYITEGAGEIADAITVDEHGNKTLDWEMIKAGTDSIRVGLEIIENGNDASDNQGASVYLSTAMDFLKNGTDILKDAGADMDSSLGFFESAIDVLEQASNDVTTVLEEASSLASFLSNTSPLQFSYVKSKVEQSGNDLHNNMTNLNRELEALNTETKASADVLTSDIRAINDQFFVVMDLLVDEIEDVKNTSLDSRIEDISDEDINSATDGKVQFCTNYGAIFGDINVGGIAGSMGIFNEQNPEESNSTINDAIRARYKLKAILLDCTNYGEITSKKDYVGCVCGISSLGVITDCKGFGKAVSDDGDYAGGISGANSTTIRNSFAKCSIGGKEYVGGITGLNGTRDNGAGSVTNCVSAIDIISSEQYAGAICGYDEGITAGNLFFGDYAGINNASYESKAEPISFEQLVAIENIPKEFKQFKLTFLAGDKIVKEILLGYMDSYSADKFPEVPPVSGQYGKWDTGSIKDIVFDKAITAEYFPYVTALSVEPEQEGTPAELIAIGKFSDTSRINLIKGTDEEISKLSLPMELFAIIKPRQALSITVEDLLNEKVFLRFNRGDDKPESLSFYLKSGDSWKKLKAKEVGSYMQIEVPSGTNEIAIAHFISFRLLVAILAVLVALGLIIFFVLKRKKRKAASV